MKARQILACVLMAITVSGCSSREDATSNSVHVESGEATVSMSEADLVFSEDSGCYEDVFDLTITGPKGATIYYTTDGSEPVVGEKSTKEYTGPIEIEDQHGKKANLSILFNASKYVIEDSVFSPRLGDLDRAAVIRAMAVAEDGSQTKIATRTYFVNNDIVKKYPDCAVMSIVTDPDYLLDGDTGIYVTGNTYKSSKDEDDINFFQKGREWERAAYIDYFSGSSTPMLSTGVGIRIHGGYTRREAQKSLNIYFREEYDYGTKGVEGYELIPGATNKIDDSSTTKFKNLMVRNGGNDASITKFQDIFIQDMVSERNFGIQEAAPCMVYLNGEYWGLYNIMEKQSDNYVETEFGVDNNNVIIYKEFELDEGEDLDADGSYLEEFMALADLDMTDEANYQLFQEKVDFDSFLDYYATEIYINNNDWWSGCNAETPRNNIMFWRVADPSQESSDNPYGDGKWRYLLYDTEWSMYLYNTREAGSQYDSIKYHALGEPDPANSTDEGRTEANGCPHFTALFQNADFRQRFTNTLLDIRNWDFAYERASETLDEYALLYTPLMYEHKVRWNNWGNISDRVLDLKKFLMERQDYVLTMLEDNISELSASDRVNVTLTSNSGEADSIKINTISPDIGSGWTGVYYKDYHVTVTAHEVEGFTFDHWELTGCSTADVNAATAQISLDASDASIQAVYKK